MLPVVQMEFIVALQGPFAILPVESAEKLNFLQSYQPPLPKLLRVSSAPISKMNVRVMRLVVHSHLERMVAVLCQMPFAVEMASPAALQGRFVILPVKSARYQLISPFH